MLFVQIKSAKGIKSTYKEDQEKMRPYVILKFGDYLGSLKSIEADHSEVEDETSKTSSSSLLNPAWDAETSSFVCPFHMNTNLSLVLMQESTGGVHYPCGHVTTNFPTYPTSDPPKLDRTVKFVRRLMSVRAGTKEENSLRHTISLYSKMVASQGVLENVHSIPPNVRSCGKLSSAGKLSFKVTIVRRSTFEKHLKINQSDSENEILASIGSSTGLGVFLRGESTSVSMDKKRESDQVSHVLASGSIGQTESHTDQTSRGNGGMSCGVSGCDYGNVQVGCCLCVGG